MTDAILYTTAGSVVGAGALGGALWLRAKWDAYIEHMVAARCADRMATEEMSIGRLALKTQQALKPDLEGLEKRLLAKIEQAKPKKIGVHVGADNEATYFADSGASNPPIKPNGGSISVDPPQPSPEPWNWRDDAEVKALAAALLDSLIKLKMPEAQARAQVITCMNRCAKCDMKNDKATHDKLFGECFKKV